MGPTCMYVIQQLNTQGGESAQFELSEHIDNGQNTGKKSITLVIRSKQVKDYIDNINTS